MPVAFGNWPEPFSQPPVGDRFGTRRVSMMEEDPRVTSGGGGCRTRDPFAGDPFGHDRARPDFFSTAPASSPDPFTGDPFAAAPAKRKLLPPAQLAATAQAFAPCAGAASELTSGFTKRARPEKAAPAFGGGPWPQQPWPGSNPFSGGCGASAAAAGQGDPFKISPEAFGGGGGGRADLRAAEMGRTKRRLRDVSGSISPLSAGGGSAASFEDMPPVHRIRTVGGALQAPPAHFGVGPQKRRAGEFSFEGRDGAPFAKVTRGPHDTFGNPVALPLAAAQEGGETGPWPMNTTCKELIVHPKFGGGLQQQQRARAMQLPRLLGPSGNQWVGGFPEAATDNHDEDDQLFSVWETHAAGGSSSGGAWGRPRLKKQPLLLCDAQPSSFGDFGSESNHGSSASSPHHGRDVQHRQDCGGDVSVWGAPGAPASAQQQQQPQQQQHAGSAEAFPWTCGVPVNPRERRKHFQAQQQQRQRRQQQQEQHDRHQRQQQQQGLWSPAAQQQPLWAGQGDDQNSPFVLPAPAPRGVGPNALPAPMHAAHAAGAASRKRRPADSITAAAAFAHPVMSVPRMQQQHSVFSPDLFNCD